MELIANGAGQVFPVTDGSHVGEVRRAAAAVAESVGFDESGRGRVGLVTTEIAKNLAVHAKQGEILLRPVAYLGTPGVELLAVDRGPGMADYARCSRDGFSSAGTAGIGLGAVARMSDEFDVHSTEGVGTVLVARMWASPHATATERSWDVGVLSVPKPGQAVCGDAFAVRNLDGRSVAFVGDGLGYGPQAAAASSAAREIFEANADRPPGEIIDLMHRGIRTTRGAAVAIARVDWAARQLTYSGVGNIAGVMLSGGDAQNLMSHNGTVGHVVGRVQNLSYPLPPASLVVMNSDGLNTRWNLDKYPGAASRDLSLVAGLLYRDHRRERDDVTVVVLRERPG
jgi:anti-sigma regulatory factor (Ser/Thr protein kinase)